jgi:transposase InsO family protein
MRAEFADHDGLLLKGTSLVIPAVLQKDILSRLHEVHQGIVKCRECARNTVWWLGINKQLDEVVRNRRTCAETRSDKAEPMMCLEFPNRSWEKVASDLFEHNKQSYLLVVDYYSRYNEIARLYSTSSNAVINHLKSIFARHRIPQTFISDNGPQYCGNASREFAKSYGFEHITSSPRYPQSNRLAERAVETVKHMLTKSEDPYLALLAYRTTPLGNGYSLSELLMGRRLQSTLPIVSDELKPRQANNELLGQKERDYKQRQKLNYDRCHRATNLEKLEPNDNVYVKDQKI